MNEELKKKLAMIPDEAPDELDRQIALEAQSENDGTTYAWSDVKEELKEVREARKKKGDLHVRIAASLHEEIIDEAQNEGISLNQYVATALAYYIGHTQAKQA